MSRRENTSRGQGKCPCPIREITDEEYNAPRNGGLEVPAVIGDVHGLRSMKHLEGKFRPTDEAVIPKRK